MKQEFVKVAIVRSDGGISLMEFATVGRGNSLPRGATWVDEAAGFWQRPASVDNVGVEVMRSFADPNGPQPVSFRVLAIAEETIVADREFRDALTDSGGQLQHDMPTARLVRLANLRRARDRELQNLDPLWMRATGQKDLVKAEHIEAERQALRDMPQRVAPLLAAARTVDELKLVR